ncbi:MAG: menaquinone biosynthesis protein [Chthoniobacteraceae bacterium]
MEKLKIGCVQYLNAKPLIFGYEGAVHFDHPSRLAKLLAEGEIDIALVPTFELMRAPDYDVADGVAISAVGAVYSVFLAYRGELKDIKKVSLDTASLTSVNLIRCILAEFHGMTPEYVSPENCADENAAQLLIGNQAIDFRQAHGEEYRYLDLGEEWMQQTGLPFVFAVWLIRRDVEDAAAAAGELRTLKAQGLGCIYEIVRREKRYDADFETRYLSHYIRYDLGEAEKAGMAKFRELLTKHGLVSGSEAPLVFL